METKQLFAAKFGELEAQYARIAQRFLLCRNADADTLRREYAQIMDECLSWEEILTAQAANGRSKAVEALAEAQRAYCSQSRKILEELPRYLQGSPEELRAESAALYAEYTLDAAAQAMRCALLAVLYATVSQLEAEPDAAEDKREEILT